MIKVMRMRMNRMIEKINLGHRVKIREKSTSFGFSLYLDYVQAGKRYRKSIPYRLDCQGRFIGLNSRENVVYLRDQAEAELLARDAGDVFKKKRVYKASDLWRKFQGSGDKNRQSAGNYILPILGDCLVNEIDSGVCERLRSELLKNLQPGTVKTYLQIFKAFLNSLVRMSIIDSNPADGLPRVKVPQSHREYLSMQELGRLIDKPINNRQIRNAFLLSCFTGLRYSDIVGLRFNDVAENCLVICQKKVKEIVSIPLHPRAKEILREQRRLNKGEFVFDLPDLSWVLAKIKEWAGEGITFHSARHTFASILVNQGVPIYTVSKLLGHSNIRTTQIYAKLEDATKQEAVNTIVV